MAVLSRSGGRGEALLFDSSPLLPSAVFADPGGALLTGRDAERSARIDPAAFEPHPKRRIDDVELFLGGRGVPVVTLVEAILRRVAEESARAGGRPPEATVLTHPSGWGPPRRALLLDGAARAGLPAVALVPEPVAAAMYFTAVLGHHVADGHAIVVYDFGGGTFDISVVRRCGAGWDVAAAQGLDDVGGADLDAAIVGWAGRQVAARDPDLWARLENPATTVDRRHRRALWDDARSAKELLSRATSAGLAVPLFDVDLHLTRAEFESLARPWLDRTVTLTTSTLFTSGVSAERMAGVFLVGGSSRVPLVATLLHRALGVAPVVLEQPELVVALGSLLVHDAGPPSAVPSVPTLAPIAPAPPAPVSAVPVVSAPPAPAMTTSPTPFAAQISAPPAAASVSPPVVPMGADPHAANGFDPPARSRRFSWRLVVASAVVVLGLAGLWLHENVYYPPMLIGLFAPVTPKPVTILLAMTLLVAATGDGAARAYRALGVALPVAAGWLLALVIPTAANTTPGYVLDFADGLALRPVTIESFYDQTLHRIFAVAALLPIPAGILLLVRRTRADPLQPPPGRIGRWLWAGGWALGGAVLMLGAVSPVAYPQWSLDGNQVREVGPLEALLHNGGALTWYAGFLLGTVVTVGAWLLVGAALRPLVTRRPVLRIVALALVIALGLAAELGAAWDQDYMNNDGDAMYRITEYYWRKVVAPPYHGIAWIELTVALLVIAAIAVPSYLRSRRSDTPAGGN
ncbi:Hsp70 family protein [Dactylosporangium sp. CA-233914]|uniref:Hsp70 family protein n=1 Tax=Dactylosporangium sp. CA-233914 TaxID=3239934 RepID=UPI003D94F643